MQTVAFGYKCEECGRGTVSERHLPEYPTKIRGYPFVVKGARIGVCDSCGAEHFGAQEVERWEHQFEEEHARNYLSPHEIQALRKALGLSMEQFAFLIGCTRQSLYNWERHNRSRPQSRMADLLMKLVGESQAKEQVHVLEFLTQQSEQLGIHIEPHGSRHASSNPATLVLAARRISSLPKDAASRELVQMAADTFARDQQVVVVDSEKVQPIGKLSYDFVTASLGLELDSDPDSECFDIEIRFADGSIERSSGVRVKNRKATLLEGTSRKEDEVSEVVLTPCQ